GIAPSTWRAATARLEDRRRRLEGGSRPAAHPLREFRRPRVAVRARDLHPLHVWPGLDLRDQPAASEAHRRHNRDRPGWCIPASQHTVLILCNPGSITPVGLASKTQEGVLMGPTFVFACLVSLLAAGVLTPQQPVSMRVEAPELRGVTEWVNTKPL